MTGFFAQEQKYWFPQLSANHPCSEVAKETQIITLPPPTLNVGIIIFFFIINVCVIPGVTECTHSKEFHFVFPPAHRIFIQKHQDVF